MRYIKPDGFGNLGILSSSTANYLLVISQFWKDHLIQHNLHYKSCDYHQQMHVCLGETQEDIGACML